MREMDHDQAVASPLREITTAATEFGLSSDDVLSTMDEAVHVTGTELPVSEFLDELSGMLARRILIKEQTRFRD